MRGKMVAFFPPTFCIFVSVCLSLFLCVCVSLGRKGEKGAREVFEGGENGCLCKLKGEGTNKTILASRCACRVGEEGCAQNHYLGGK